MAETTPNGKTEAATVSSSPVKATAKKKGAGKIVMLGCVLVACAVIALCIIGTAVAFFSNRNIPLFSSLVEKGENLSTTKDQRAQMVQDDMKDFVFSTILSQKQAGDKSIIKVSASDEEINKLINEKTDSKSMRFSGSYTESKLGSTQKLNFVGFYNGGMLKSSFDGDINYNSSKNSIKGEVRVIDGVGYVNLSDISSSPIIGLPNSFDVRNEWISMQLTGANGAVNSISSVPIMSQSKSLNSDDLNKIKQFIDSDEMTRNIVRTDDQVIHGVRTNCFKVDLTTDDLRAMGKRMMIISGLVISENLINDSLPEGNTLLLNVCSGRVDNHIYKLDLEANLVGNKTQAISNQKKVILHMDFWDYDSVEDTTSVPSHTLTLQDIMTQVFSIPVTESVTSPNN